MYGDLNKTKHSFPSELQRQKPKHSDSNPTRNIYLPNFVARKIPSDLHHSPYHGLPHLVFNYIIQKGIRCNGDNLSFRNTTIYTFRHSSFQSLQVVQYVYNTNTHISKTNRKSLKTQLFRPHLQTSKKEPPHCRTTILQICATLHRSVIQSTNRSQILRRHQEEQKPTYMSLQAHKLNQEKQSIHLLLPP